MSMSKFDGHVKGMLLYPTVYEELDVTRKIKKSMKPASRRLI